MEKEDRCALKITCKSQEVVCTFVVICVAVDILNGTAKRPSHQSRLGLLRSECRAAKVKQLNKQWFISEVHGEDERQQPKFCVGVRNTLHGRVVVLSPAL